jgi:hypothetical protein
MNGLNIVRFRRMQKRGIDPFKVERSVQEETLLRAKCGGFVRHRPFCQACGSNGPGENGLPGHVVADYRCFCLSCC